jgi:enoyl-CoA hydratase/carnithine racemase
MGLAKANEALLWGKKITAEELERNGFVKCVPLSAIAHFHTNDLTFDSKIFSADDTESFHKATREYLLDRLDGLDPAALLSTKRMIQVRFRPNTESFKSNGSVLLRPLLCTATRDGIRHCTDGDA